MRIRVFLELTMISALLSGAWQAFAQNQDQAGSKDHSLISRYPGSYIEKYEQKEFDEYDLPVGASTPDKPPKTQHLEGKVTTVKYVVPKGRSTLEIFRNYEQALEKGGFQELFQCTDVACGNSGSGPFGFYGGWNNRYLAAKLARPEGDVYAAVNISNLNQDWLYLVVVELKPMEGGLITVDAATLANDIGRTGHSAVYGIYFDSGKAEVKPESEAALREIAKLLQKEQAIKLYVVGHTDNQGSLGMNMDLSRRRAAAVVQVLTSRYGVSTTRLGAEGDGPTAPVASNDSEDGRAKNRRVELVKQ